MFFQIFFFIINHGEGLTYGNFKNDQERFNYGLEELGIVDEEKNRLIKKYKSLENSENEEEQKFFKEIKNISSADDLFKILKEGKK